MGRTIVYTRPAARALVRMPANTEAQIREKLRTLADDPTALSNNIKALKGAEGFRLRIGDWRVIFTIEPDRVIVHAVGPRGSIYG
ncbi:MULTISPECIES: type II toxin-antitoxin system RelE/ParE family toxin [unclassified Methylobacterium]|uniref:type II toxin-antitoxin system RelE family toxin n=1 Tax=unclassified Methylobacterium TaxID=2615210 RepID=UPI0009E7D8B0|nr:MULTISPECIES: type II toxin-antitoxin system RelE/ParE family toxin [unclassified Methylobacterium]